MDDGTRTREVAQVEVFGGRAGRVMVRTFLRRAHRNGADDLHHEGRRVPLLAQVQADLDRGQWRDPLLGQVSVEAWAREWLASNPAKRPTTRARDETVLHKHFVPALG